MAVARGEGGDYAGRTAWARNLTAPVREFLSTETGGAMVLLGAIVAALLWANSPRHRDADRHGEVRTRPFTRGDPGLMCRTKRRDGR